ncbi:MAG: hypothetical protein PHE88_08345 [Elusimicrobia bacterium]|nr:hypothetical protein [Elusimicrobiota bacterium]
MGFLHNDYKTRVISGLSSVIILAIGIVIVGEIYGYKIFFRNKLLVIIFFLINACISIIFYLFLKKIFYNRKNDESSE